MAGLTPPPTDQLRPKQPRDQMVCHQLDEDRDPGVVEWIRHCQRCGSAVYVTPLFMAPGYRITCYWCHPPSIHPQMLAGLDTEATAG